MAFDAGNAPFVLDIRISKRRFVVNSSVLAQEGNAVAIAIVQLNMCGGLVVISRHLDRTSTDILQKLIQ